VKFPKVFFLLVPCMMLSANLLAVDGVVLINQATVMAAGGFPYNITQSGSYKLSGNLVVPANVDGIDISTDFVLLDLNGFTIKGPGTCNAGSGPPTQCSGNSSFGILIFGDNVTVRNGSVEGMADGVFGGSLVEEVHVSNNLQGIQAGEAVVRRCTAHNNSAGIALFGSGVAEANDVSRNQFGLTVVQGTAIGNSVNNNTIGFQPRNSVYGSNSFQNNGTDIFVSGAVVNVSQNNNICTAGQC
jgi:hypothetical protein